jgi:hypothetical protein
MLSDNLVTDGAEILDLGCGNAASQVEQGIRQRLQNDFIPSVYESDPIAFPEIQ